MPCASAARKRAIQAPMRLGPGLQRGAVDDQAAGDLGDHLGLHQAVGLQGGAGRRRGRRSAARGRGRGPAPSRRSGGRSRPGCRGRRSGGGRCWGIWWRPGRATSVGGSSVPAVAAGSATDTRQRADAEVERRVDLRVIELHQHVGAADADLGGAERDEGGDVEAAHADDVERRVVGGEAKSAGCPRRRSRARGGCRRRSSSGAHSARMRPLGRARMSGRSGPAPRRPGLSARKAAVMRASRGCGAPGHYTGLLRCGRLSRADVLCCPAGGELCSSAS